MGAAEVDAAQIFTIFFVMLGPLKILGPFVRRTSGIDQRASRRIAWWTFLIATVSIVAGGLLGRSVLQNWQVSLPALRLSAGIVFFLVALRQLLEQYQPPHAVTDDPLPSQSFAAASRLVFPMVLTPYGIAAVIALVAGSTTTSRTVTIIAMVLLVMTLNLVAMLLARQILVGFTPVMLQVVGAVLAVLQVALSLQIIIGGLQLLGVPITKGTLQEAGRRPPSALVSAAVRTDCDRQAPQRL